MNKPTVKSDIDLWCERAQQKNKERLETIMKAAGIYKEKSKEKKRV